VKLYVPWVLCVSVSVACQVTVYLPGWSGFTDSSLTMSGDAEFCGMRADYAEEAMHARSPGGGVEMSRRFKVHESDPVLFDAADDASGRLRT
jgi:hypothetical protein